MDVRHRMCALSDSHCPSGGGDGWCCRYKDVEADVKVNASKTIA